jgi:hypothetical protein
MEQPNFKNIDKLTRGDEDIKNMLIDVIKTEFPIEKKQYLENFNSKNLEKTAENVHKLKSKISILGLLKSYEIANTYEHNLKGNSIEGYKDFEKILNTISDFVEKI